jgi:hypothetical protein
MVTWPLAAVRVTGKVAAVAAETPALPEADADADAEPAVDDVLAAADVVLEDEEQPARAAVQAAAVPSTAASRREVFMVSYFLPSWGRKARPLGRRELDTAAAETDHPSHEGRYRLACRRRPGLDLAWCGIFTVAGQRRNSLGYEASPASLPGVPSACRRMTAAADAHKLTRVQ